MTTELTISQLADLVGGKVLRGSGDQTVRRVMPIEVAVDDAVTFVTKPKYLRHLGTTRAAAVLAAPDLLDRKDVEIPERLAVIGVDSPYVAFARAAQTFADRVPQPIGVHPSAVIEASAKLGDAVAIGPFVYVGAGAEIGDGAVLHAGAHVETCAKVGPGTILYNHAVVRHGCTVGARCILHPGVVIGSDGFGFAQDTGDGTGVVHVKIPQTGDVVIEDDVEIGSNSCVDRATLGTTRIGTGSKIDNLVQLGHNVQIGPGCILVAQSGVAGSSRLGARAMLGAQAGIAGHLEIGEGAVVLAQAGVMTDIEPGAKVCGAPAVPSAEFFRTVVRVGKLDALMDRVRKLERLLGGART